MRIKVRGYLTLRDAVGGRPDRVIEADRLTVGGLIERLAAEFGGRFAEAAAGGALIVLVNGRHCSHLPDGLETELADGDEVAVFPPVAGG
jgi:MoaD family protein